MLLGAIRLDDRKVNDHLTVSDTLGRSTLRGREVRQSRKLRLHGFDGRSLRETLTESEDRDRRGLRDRRLEGLASVLLLLRIGQLVESSERRSESLTLRARRIRQRTNRIDRDRRGLRGVRGALPLVVLLLKASREALGTVANRLHVVKAELAGVGGKRDLSLDIRDEGEKLTERAENARHHVLIVLNARSLRFRGLNAGRRRKFLALGGVVRRRGVRGRHDDCSVVSGP